MIFLLGKHYLRPGDYWTRESTGSKRGTVDGTTTLDTLHLITKADSRAGEPIRRDIRIHNRKVGTWADGSGSAPRNNSKK
jgi:hypothetical protein